MRGVIMPSPVPGFPENRFAENRSPDPNDRMQRGTQEGDVDHDHDRHDSNVLKKPRRFSRKDVEENIPPAPDPDDPMAP
jgi:hypothetical protein